MFNRPHSLNNLHTVEVWMYRLSSKDELLSSSLVHLTWRFRTEVNFLEESERSGAGKSFLELSNNTEEQKLYHILITSFSHSRRSTEPKNAIVNCHL